MNILLAYAQCRYERVLVKFLFYLSMRNLSYWIKYFIIWFLFVLWPWLWDCGLVSRVGKEMGYSVKQFESTLTLICIQLYSQ